MPEKDQPPEEIWLNPEALQEHFEQVKASYSSGNSDREEVPDLEQNELTRGIKRR